MRRSPLPRSFVVPILAAATIVAAQQQEPSSTAGILSRPVANFQAESVAAPEALLQLGQSERIPFALEYFDQDLMSTPISLHLRQTSVRTVLAVLFPGDKGYEFGERNGLIYITNSKLRAINRNLLDTSIRRYQIGVISTQEAANVLDMSLKYTLDPTIQGFAGNYRTGDLNNRVGPLDEGNKTVAELLDEIVVNCSKGAAWMATRPPDALDDVSGDLWAIFDYESPPRNYEALIRAIADGERVNATSKSTNAH